MFRIIGILTLLLVMTGLRLNAEPLSYFLAKDVIYDQSVLNPEAFLGHEVGRQPIRHDQMVAYIEKLAVGSPRMTVETIGYSHEGRPIQFLVITSPENHARLADIRRAHIEGIQGPERADMPVITWLNYGVHGAEASGMDAAIPVLYHLAAATGPTVEKQLQESIILVTAVFNPDGHSRRISWQTQQGSEVLIMDPAHEMHHESWPGARTNHYLFDLNRQWLLQTQPESKAWLAKWHMWKPNVSADFHEMDPDTTYYFHPGVPTRTHPLIPMGGRKLLDEIAGYHARWMDSEAKLYFSEEGFDNYYVGKGSTYPQLNGSIGILFEAGGQMGTARESEQGVKTFAENIQTHTGTSLTTIAGAVAMRGKLQAYQRQFFESAIGAAEDDSIKAYVFQAPEDPVRVAMFLELLQRHDIRVYETKGKLKAEDRTYGAGSYIMPMNQPQYRLARAIFERVIHFEDKVFYDVSGWTLPLAYGLDYAEVTVNPVGLLGDIAKATVAQAPAPGVAAYGYIFRWSDYDAPKALYSLLSKGVLARALKNAVKVQTTKGEIAFDRGAIFIPRHRQPMADSVFDGLAQKAAAENRITIHAVTSGHTSTAGADLGGRFSVADLAAPKPLLLVGDGVSPYDAGEVWHVLDHRVQIPLTLVNKDRFKKVDLNRYTHILLVGGSGSVIPDGMKTNVIKWVEAGGTLVAHQQGAKFVHEKLLDRKAGINEPSAFIGRKLYSQKEQNDAEHVIGGAVFESILDLSHPMAFGLVRPTVATNRDTVFTLPEPRDDYGRVAIYSSAPLLSGYASEKRVKDIRKSPMMTAERKGKGAIILFADNPNFRGTYPAAEKLYLNALFLSLAFEKEGSGSAAAAYVEE